MKRYIWGGISATYLKGQSRENKPICYYTLFKSSIFNPLNHGIGLVCVQSFKAYNLTVQYQKSRKISYSMQNVLGTLTPWLFL